MEINFDDIAKMTKVELRAACRSVKLRGYGNMTVAQMRSKLWARERFTESLVLLRELGDKRVTASTLEGLGVVVATLDGPLQAARIWGAAERLRAEIGSPLAPGAKARYYPHVAAARAVLGDDAAFSHAWQEGRALTLEQALDLALAIR